MCGHAFLDSQCHLTSWPRVLGLAVPLDFLKMMVRVYRRYGGISSHWSCPRELISFFFHLVLSSVSLQDITIIAFCYRLSKTNASISLCLFLHRLSRLVSRYIVHLSSHQQRSRNVNSRGILTFTIVCFGALSRKTLTRHHFGRQRQFLATEMNKTHLIQRSKIFYRGPCPIPSIHCVPFHGPPTT